MLRRPQQWLVFQHLEKQQLVILTEHGCGAIRLRYVILYFDQCKRDAILESRLESMLACFQGGFQVEMVDPVNPVD